MSQRGQERAAVVAWLRSNSIPRRIPLRDRIFYVWTALVWPDNLSNGAWLAAADAIERGAHLKGKP